MTRARLAVRGRTAALASLSLFGRSGGRVRHHVEHEAAASVVVVVHVPHRPCGGKGSRTLSGLKTLSGWKP
eukprot:1188233-Prorocentrum_minimum.AAC.2